MQDPDTVFVWMSAHQPHTGNFAELSWLEAFALGWPIGVGFLAVGALGFLLGWWARPRYFKVIEHHLVAENPDEKQIREESTLKGIRWPND